MDDGAGDDGAGDDGAPGRPGHPAASAVNWRRILLTDAGVGLVFVAIGLVLMATWVSVIGAGVVAFGGTYLVLVGRRFRVWRALRRDAGLPT